MPNDKTKRRMTVITSDDRRIGFVNWPDANDKVLRVTFVRAGRGYDHGIPHDWVAEVGQSVYLNKTKTFVAANWRR